MFLPHFDVFCDLLLNRRTAPWNLIVLYNNNNNNNNNNNKHTTTEKAIFYFKIFPHDSKAFLCPLRPLWQPRKKAIWRNLLSIQMRQSDWLLCVAKENHAHCQTWLECRLSWKENLQRKQNWTANSTSLKENAGKVKSVFVIRAALWAKKLGRCLEYRRTLKICSE